jgi:hypothetical protein
MNLRNMRANGVRTLTVYCSNSTCRHEAIVNVDAYGDDVAVPSLGPRMRCERCEQLGADARPNWNERAPPSLFGRPPSLWRTLIAGDGVW